jgi:kynurenine formamidase
MAREIPSEEEVISWFDKYSNWGRWGPEDEMGTMNFITPEKRVQAAQLVKDGVTISCGRPLEFETTVDYPGKGERAVYHTARRFVERHLEPPGGRTFGNGDSLLVNLHGGGRTHIDAPSHFMEMGPEGRMYNGFPGHLSTAFDGGKLQIDLLGNGVMSRGVLLDIARLKNKRYLDGGEAIFPEDLEAAEKAEGVRVGEGDILLVRTGHTVRRKEDPVPFGNWPGSHATCVPWFHERRIAMLATDTPNDVNPSGYPTIGLPVHRLGLVALGLWLLDHCNHEDISAACAERKRWEFMFAFAPLRVAGITGMPVNPFAIL